MYGVWEDVEGGDDLGDAGVPAVLKQKAFTLGFLGRLSDFLL